MVGLQQRATPLPTGQLAPVHTANHEVDTLSIPALALPSPEASGGDLFVFVPLVALGVYSGEPPKVWELLALQCPATVRVLLG